MLDSVALNALVRMELGVALDAGASAHIPSDSEKTEIEEAIVSSELALLKKPQSKL